MVSIHRLLGYEPSELPPFHGAVCIITGTIHDGAKRRQRAFEISGERYLADELLFKGSGYDGNVP